MSNRNYETLCREKLVNTAQQIIFGPTFLRRNVDELFSNVVSWETDGVKVGRNWREENASVR